MMLNFKFLFKFLTYNYKFNKEGENMLINIKDKFKPIRGKIEIFDKNNNLYKSIENLVLTASRAAILQVLFNDDKIYDAIHDNNIISPLPSSNDVRKLICGFAFGEGGSKINISPSTVYVPSHNDSFENNTFQKIPFLKVIETTNNGIKFENNGSYENLDEIINSSVSENSSITISNNNIIQQTNTTNVKYFYSKDNNYYCKTFDINKNVINYEQITGELDYIITLEVENHDLIGEIFSEIGLVIANCNVSQGSISAIDNDSVRLATRATFTPISLSTELLSSFTIKYHIFI